MSEIKHPAQQLRQAEVEFQLAARQSTRLDQERCALANTRPQAVCGALWDPQSLARCREDLR